MNFFLVLLLTFTFSFSGYSQIIKQQIPDKLVVLTFDDATESHYSTVAPLLKKYGFGATFFVCEFPPNFKDSTKYMNWRQIKALDNMGFEVANHTRTHTGMSQLTKRQFRAELKSIEHKCDSMNIVRPIAFAYPGYDLNESAFSVLQERGYEFARAGGSRVYNPLVDHPFLIPSWAMKSDNKKQIMNAFRQAHNGKIVVLTVHGVPDIEHPWVSTPPALFKEYLQYLSENHFKVIAMRDLNKYINVKRARKIIVPDLNKELKNY